MFHHVNTRHSKLSSEIHSMLHFVIVKNIRNMGTEFLKIWFEFLTLKHVCTYIQYYNAYKNFPNCKQMHFVCHKIVHNSFSKLKYTL